MSFPFGFGILNTAGSALTADQELMDIIGQNVANAQTPGYVNQQGVLTENIPYPPSNYPNPSSPGQLGTGVQVSAVTQSISNSLNNAYQSENSSVGNSTETSQILQQVQSALGESGSSGTSSAGISTLMGTFFQSLQSLAQNPSDLSLRNAVLQAAQNLVNGIHSLNSSLSSIVSNANQSVVNDVQQVNQDLNQIAQLNQQIKAIQAVPGQNANDLIDQRDQLLNQLSNLINIQVSYEPSGSAIVSMGGVEVVQGSQVNLLTTYTDSNGNTQLQFKNTPSVSVPLNNGELYGIINTRDNIIGNIATPGTLYYQLNQDIGQMAAQVNSISQLGYTANGTTNVPFFNSDPDNDGDVDAGIGTNADSGTDNINWLSGIQVGITDPNNIANTAAFVSSVQNMNNASTTIDPSQILSSDQAAGDFLVTPSSASGTITINGVNINWNNTQSINQILQNITNSGAGVTATFDPNSQEIVLARNTTQNQTYLGAGIPSPNITVSDTSGNLSQVFLINTTGNPAPFPTAVSAPGGSSDNTNLNYLSGLQTSSNPLLGNASISQFYDTIVSNLGTQTSNAQTNLNQAQSVLNQTSNQIQSVSGVNLNEEAIALSQAQESFNAAAKVVQVINQVLNTLITGPGAGL